MSACVLAQYVTECRVRARRDVQITPNIRGMCPGRLAGAHARTHARMRRLLLPPIGMGLSVLIGIELPGRVRVVRFGMPVAWSIAFACVRFRFFFGLV